MAEDWKKIKVNLKNGDTECYLNVPFLTSEGTLGTPLTVGDARSALKHAQVVYGIREKNLQSLFEEGLFDQEVLVAEGVPPKNGLDARIEYYFDTKRDFQPKEDEDGRVDYHEVSIFVSVAKGDKLCRLIPATEGSSGVSVTGKDLMPKAGKDRLLPQGKNTEISPHDPSLLVASTNGCVALNSTGLVEVQPTLHIKGDVDFNTGNIKFVGSLSVGGDIKSGFKVEVTGNLEVGGCVEDAEVKVEGGMLLKKGFIGRGNGRIETTGDMTIKYCHGQNIVCGGNLTVGGELMHSRVRAVGDIIANSRKGVIMGGQIESQGNIHVTYLGSTNYAQTEVSVGTDFTLLDRLREIDMELKKVQENQDKVKKALYNFSVLKTKMKGQLSPEHQTLFERLQETSRYYPKYQSEMEQEKRRINQEISQHKEAWVKVGRTLYPGVRITIGRFTRVFNEQLEGAVLREVRGEIVASA